MLKRLLVTLLAGLLVTALGCGKKRSHIAELLEVSSGAAEKAVSGAEWSGARVGDTFSTGDAVRTSADGGARIRFVGGSGLRMGKSTTIRFGRGALELEGEVEAEEDTAIDLEFGRAELAAGARVSLRTEDGQLRFDVLLGSAKIVRGDEIVAIAEGEALDVEIGGAIVRRAKIVEPPDAGVADAAIEVDAAPEPLATVSAVVKGRGARLREEGGKWARLRAGEHELEPNTEVKLKKGTSIAVVRGQERARLVGAGELKIGTPGEPLLSTTRGGATIEATEVDVTISVPGGQIIARSGPGAGSKANIQTRGGKTSVRARSGRIDVVGDAGGRERIEIGERASLNRGGAIEILDRAPAVADFAISAGSGGTIHDPRPPTALRIRFGESCPGEGIVEVARGRSFRRNSRIFKGSGGANISIGRGAHSYRVRCIVEGNLQGKAAASGRVSVVRGTGTRPLSTVAPMNVVDADGRTYTVLYQNLLPTISFRWPGASPSGRYVLHLKPSSGAERTFNSSVSEHTVKSGKLKEGSYRYWFEAGGRSSKRSTLVIDFDNEADKGYVRFPRVGASWSSPLRVSGATTKGWSVSVEGQDLSLDRQRRFNTEIAVPSGQRGLAIRFSHPRRGTHYYLRRNKK